jgi:uncharacterized repeat protein (TIGR02543 family)
VRKVTFGLNRLPLALLLTFIVTVVGLPQAYGANFTVTYDANANYVGAYSQAGITTGSLPATTSIAQGSTVNVAAQGNLARQGFTFGGWNTAANGSGTTYAAGTSSFVLGAANVTLYAKWEVPVAARLIGNGGTIIQVLNTNSVTDGGKCVSAGIRGITSDGTHIYFRPSTNLGYICKVTSAGVVVSVHQVAGLENVAEQSIAIVYGNGCLFLRKDASTTFNSIYCIALSNWSLNSVALNGNTLPAGSFWLYANFIQFPDGRIGSVGTSVASNVWPGGEGTGAGKCPAGMYCKTLRLFTVSGTGTSVTTSYSTDFILADSASSWPSDDHGIATDGTYLYQIRHASGYKVWALRSDGPSYLVFNGDESGSCGAATGQSGTQCTITYPINGLSSGGALANSTYFGRAHGLNKYLVGDYDVTSKFWLSSAAVPPDGPGNPDVVAPSYTSTDTFTVAENIATSFNAATVIVNESSTLTIASGADRLLFDIIRIDTASAYIRFKASPDFEGPTDSGTNNVYNITINATDLAGNIGIRAINITVTNVNESSSTSPPAVSGNVYKGIVASLTVTVNTPGKVRFFMDGKRIASCLAVATTGSYPNYTASCSWKPTVTARHSVTATLTPTDNTFAASTSQAGTFWVLKRTTLR